jgi:hypothetical protein
MKWHRPPPLCDCCNPPTQLENLIWRIQAWWYYCSPWGRRRERLWEESQREKWEQQRKEIQALHIINPDYGISIDDIISVQPMVHNDKSPAIN